MSKYFVDFGKSSRHSIVGQTRDTHGRVMIVIVIVVYIYMTYTMYTLINSKKYFSLHIEFSSTDLGIH